MRNNNETYYFKSIYFFYLFIIACRYINMNIMRSVGRYKCTGKTFIFIYFFFYTFTTIRDFHIFFFYFFNIYIFFFILFAHYYVVDVQLGEQTVHRHCHRGIVTTIDALLKLHGSPRIYNINQTK